MPQPVNSEGFSDKHEHCTTCDSTLGPDNPGQVDPNGRTCLNGNDEPQPVVFCGRCLGLQRYFSISH